MSEIEVVLADDHPIVLLGMREIIQRDGRFKVAAEATSPSQLVGELLKHAPQVLITDFNMPGDSSYGDGLKLIEYLIRRFPGMQILVLTMISNSLILSRLHELGVVGVIQKSHMQEDIQRALDALASHRSYRSRIRQVASSQVNSQQVDERFASLSQRETEVLRLFVAGHSVSDIARQVNRSTKTVSAQKVSAMRKLDVGSDQELLTYCIRTGQFQ